MSKQPPTTADILRELRTRIGRHEIPPGSKLREQQLAQEFRVTRPKIREVLGALEQRGLVERIPNQGAVVRRLDLSQVFEIYDVREVLEGLCARLAAERAPKGFWEADRKRFGAPMDKLIRTGNLETYVTELEGLRQRIIQMAGNPVLSDLLDAIHDRTQVIIRRIIILPGRAEQGLQEHRAVLAALAKRDGEAAERLRRANIRSAREYLRRFQSFVL